MGYFTDLLNRIGTSLKEVGSGLSPVYKPDLKESADKVLKSTEMSGTPIGLAKDVFVEAPARAVQSVVQSATGVKEYTPKGNFEKFIFGGEPIKDIGTRTQEAQQFIKEKVPALSGASQPLAFLGVIGMTAFDLTPFGGEKNVLKSIVKVSKFDDALKIAKKIGIAEDKINDFAKTAVAVKTEKEAKNLLNGVSNIAPEVKKSSQEVAPTLQKTKQSTQELPKSEGIARLDEVLPQQIEKSVSSISNDITTLQKSKGVNVNNLKISQEGKDLINQEATDLAQQIIQKTGKVLKNEEVIKLAEQTSKQFKGAISKEQTAQWEAAILKTRQKLAKAAESGVVDKDFIENYISVKTIGTDIARKLQSLSISADPDKFNVGTILDAIIKQTGNADEIINAAKGVDFNDYKQAVEFYRKFIKPKAGEWIDLLRYNSMLSSPNTHLINAFSNLLNSSLIAPIEKSVTGGIDFLGSAITGKARKYFAGEGLKFAQGYFKNIKQATTDFAEVMKGKAPIGQLDIRRIPLATKGRAKVVENILSYPLKLLEASDRFFMRLTESGEMAALEYRAGKGVPVKMVEAKATEAAKYRLFRQELKTDNQGAILDAVDSFTQSLEGLRNHKNPFVSWPAKMTVPFIRTPMNILKQGIEYSPVGLTTLGGAKNKTEQLSKAIVGSALAAGASVLALSDRLTFGEPTGATEKQAFRQAGRQAYSVKIGDKWVSYQKLPPPLAFNFAIVAGIKDAYDKKTIDDNTLDLFFSSLAKVGGFFSDQSYVKSVGDMLSSIQGGEAGIQRVISNYPLQLIPFRALEGWFTRLLDPSQRKIDTDAGFFEKELQTLMTNFPVLSQLVPARLDKDGNPIPNFNRYWNAFSPVRVQTENKKMEEFFQQRTEFYKKIKEQSDIKANAKKEFQSTYDKIQELKNSGKLDEAKSILNGLTDEQYELYKSMKSTDKSQATTEAEIQMMPKYKEIQKLKSSGKIEEAKAILNALSDKEYEIYKKLKNRVE